jgi:hypothetical protein
VQQDLEIAEIRAARAVDLVDRYLLESRADILGQESGR